MVKRKLYYFQRLNENKCITGDCMKCFKKHVKEGFVMWFLFDIPQIQEFHSRLLFCLKIDHVFFIQNAPLFLFEIFEMHYFFKFHHVTSFRTAEGVLLKDRNSIIRF